MVQREKKSCSYKNIYNPTPPIPSLCTTPIPPPGQFDSAALTPIEPINQVKRRNINFLPFRSNNRQIDRQEATDAQTDMIDRWNERQDEDERLKYRGYPLEMD